MAVIFITAMTDLGRNLDNRLYDKLALENQGPAPNDIALISIDNQSLSQLGRWPWSREVHAKMISLLSQADVAAIAYNIAFVEPDNSAISKDPLLRTAIAEQGKLVLPVFAEQGQTIYPFRKNRILKGSIYGHVDLEPDQDGYLRRVYLKAGLGTPKWPAFGLAGLLQSRQMPAFLPGARSPYSHLGIQARWSRDLEVLIPFRYGNNDYHRFSFIDLYLNPKKMAALRNKVVFVGIEASGIEQKYPIAAGHRQVLSGISIQANLFESLRSASALTPIIPIWGIIYALIFCSLLYAGLFLFQQQRWLKRLLLLLIFPGSAVAPMAIYSGYWLMLAPALAGSILTLAFFALQQLSGNNKERRSDEVTALANRRMFNDTLEAEWQRAKARQSHFSMVLFSIDQFGDFSRQYGQTRGNWLMARLAAVLAEQKRQPGDLLARIGQSQFGLILPGTANSVANKIAERALLEAQALEVEFEGHGHRQTVTLSIATTSVEHPVATNLADFSAKGWRNLEIAAHQGGDQIVNSVVKASLTSHIDQL